MTPQTSQKNTRKKKDPTEPCGDCQGTGYVVTEQGTLSRCSCGVLDHHEFELRLRKARIPDRYINKSLETFQTRDPKLRKVFAEGERYAKSFNLNEDNGLLFRGRSGAGKTHLAIAILREVIKRGHSGVYCNVTELLARLRSTYDEDAEEAESEVLYEFISCDLLILDDLGNESTSPWVLDRLYLLINRRYESSKPVIVTTNCNENELKNKVGLRIASRLYEMCKVGFPDFPDRDYRQEELHKKI